MHVTSPRMRRVGAAQRLRRWRRWKPDQGNARVIPRPEPWAPNAVIVSGEIAVDCTRTCPARFVTASILNRREHPSGEIPNGWKKDHQAPWHSGLSKPNA